MWRSATCSRERTKVGRTSARPGRRCQPRCLSLEERLLLSVSLSGTRPPGNLVGSPVVWTATAEGHGQSPVYQFRVGPTGGPSRVVRDYSTSNTFTWAPLQEGSDTIQVTVKDGFGAATGESATASYVANSRVAGSVAVVSPTANPLVALYSAPPAAGRSIRVEFRPMGSDQAWSSTASQPVTPGRSTNVFVAGMRPGTTYQMRHVLADGTASAPLTFTTGSLPTNLTFPTFAVQQAPAAGADLTQDIVFHVGIGGPPGTVDTVATDLAGDVVWYYDPVANAFPSFAPSLAPGGTILLLGGHQTQAAGADALREVDLAGNTLRETNIDAVNAQLAALGKPSIIDFNHDVQRLPNGDTAVLAESPRIIDVKGKRVTYGGDMVLVLDQNFQVAWTWDPFDHLNVRRLGTLGEPANDWTHANSISWSPADGNLLVSLRSQDWAIKIAYANGAGDGHIVWRLGAGGDFQINSAAPSPWFSHQHDVRYINDTTLTLFDNGNTRHRKNSAAHSRGQELVLDEATGIATLVTNVDLGSYAPFTGSGQKLPNGNLAFDSPVVRRTIEVLPSGKTVYIVKMNVSNAGPQYRSYLLASLYGTPTSGPLPTTAIPRRQAQRLAVLVRQVTIRLQRRAHAQQIRQLHQARLEAQRLK